MKNELNFTLTIKQYCNMKTVEKLIDYGIEDQIDIMSEYFIPQCIDEFGEDKVDEVYDEIKNEITNELKRKD